MKQPENHPAAVRLNTQVDPPGNLAFTIFIDRVIVPALQQPASGQANPAPVRPKNRRGILRTYAGIPRALGWAKPSKPPNMPVG